MDKQLYYNIITSAWKLLKDNLESCDWETVEKAFDEWNKKYIKTEAGEFAKSILFNTVEELRRIHNE